MRHVPSSEQHLARQRPRHLGAIDHRYAVDEYVLHTDGRLVGFLIGGDIVDGLRVEHDHVCPQAQLEHTSVVEFHPLRRQRAELADRVRQWRSNRSGPRQSNRQATRKLISVSPKVHYGGNRKHVLLEYRGPAESGLYAAFLLGS